MASPSRVSPTAAATAPDSDALSSPRSPAHEQAQQRPSFESSPLSPVAPHSTIIDGPRSDAAGMKLPPPTSVRGEPSMDEMETNEDAKNKDNQGGWSPCLSSSGGVSSVPSESGIAVSRGVHCSPSRSAIDMLCPDAGIVDVGMEKGKGELTTAAEPVVIEVDVASAAVRPKEGVVKLEVGNGAAVRWVRKRECERNVGDGRSDALSGLQNAAGGGGECAVSEADTQQHEREGATTQGKSCGPDAAGSDNMAVTIVPHDVTKPIVTRPFSTTGGGEAFEAMTFDQAGCYTYFVCAGPVTVGHIVVKASNNGQHPLPRAAGDAAVVSPATATTTMGEDVSVGKNSVRERANDALSGLSSSSTSLAIPCVSKEISLRRIGDNASGACPTLVVKEEGAGCSGAEERLHVTADLVQNMGANVPQSKATPEEFSSDQAGAVDESYAAINHEVCCNVSSNSEQADKLQPKIVQSHGDNSNRDGECKGAVAWALSLPQGQCESESSSEVKDEGYKAPSTTVVGDLVVEVTLNDASAEVERASMPEFPSTTAADSPPLIVSTERTVSPPREMVQETSPSIGSLKSATPSREDNDRHDQSTLVSLDGETSAGGVGTSGLKDESWKGGNRDVGCGKCVDESVRPEEKFHCDENTNKVEDALYVSSGSDVDVEEMAIPPGPDPPPSVLVDPLQDKDGKAVTILNQAAGPDSTTAYIESESSRSAVKEEGQDLERTANYEGAATEFPAPLMLPNFAVPLMPLMPAGQDPPACRGDDDDDRNEQSSFDSDDIPGGNWTDCDDNLQKSRLSAEGATVSVPLSPVSLSRPTSLVVSGNCTLISTRSLRLATPVMQAEIARPSPSSYRQPQTTPRQRVEILQRSGTGQAWQEISPLTSPTAARRPFQKAAAFSCLDEAVLSCGFDDGSCSDRAREEKIESVGAVAGDDRMEESAASLRAGGEDPYEEGAREVGDARNTADTGEVGSVKGPRDTGGVRSVREAGDAGDARGAKDVAETDDESGTSVQTAFDDTHADRSGKERSIYPRLKILMPTIAAFRLGVGHECETQRGGTQETCEMPETIAGEIDRAPVSPTNHSTLLLPHEWSAAADAGISSPPARSDDGDCESDDVSLSTAAAQPSEATPCLRSVEDVQLMGMEASSVISCDSDYYADEGPQVVSVGDDPTQPFEPESLTVTAGTRVMWKRVGGSVAVNDGNTGRDATKEQEIFQVRLGCPIVEAGWRTEFSFSLSAAQAAFAHTFDREGRFVISSIGGSDATAPDAERKRGELIVKQVPDGNHGRGSVSGSHSFASSEHTISCRSESVVCDEDGGNIFMPQADDGDDNSDSDGSIKKGSCGSGNDRVFQSLSSPMAVSPPQFKPEGGGSTNSVCSSCPALNNDDEESGYDGSFTTAPPLKETKKNCFPSVLAPLEQARVVFGVEHALNGRPALEEFDLLLPILQRSRSLPPLGGARGISRGGRSELLHGKFEDKVRLPRSRVVEWNPSRGRGQGIGSSDDASVTASWPITSHPSVTPRSTAATDAPATEPPIRGRRFLFDSRGSEGLRGSVADGCHREYDMRFVFTDSRNGSRTHSPDRDEIGSAGELHAPRVDDGMRSGNSPPNHSSDATITSYTSNCNAHVPDEEIAGEIIVPAIHAGGARALEAFCIKAAVTNETAATASLDVGRSREAESEQRNKHTLANVSKSKKKKSKRKKKAGGDGSGNGAKGGDGHRDEGGVVGGHNGGGRDDGVDFSNEVWGAGFYEDDAAMLLNEGNYADLCRNNADSTMFGKGVGGGKALAKTLIVGDQGFKPGKPVVVQVGVIVAIKTASVSNHAYGQDRARLISLIETAGYAENPHFFVEGSIRQENGPGERRFTKAASPGSALEAVFRAPGDYWLLDHLSNRRIKITATAREDTAADVTAAIHAAHAQKASRRAKDDETTALSLRDLAVAGNGRRIGKRAGGEGSGDGALRSRDRNKSKGRSSSAGAAVLLTGDGPLPTSAAETLKASRGGNVKYAAQRPGSVAGTESAAARHSLAEKPPSDGDNCRVEVVTAARDIREALNFPEHVPEVVLSTPPPLPSTLLQPIRAMREGGSPSLDDYAEFKKFDAVQVVTVSHKRRFEPATLELGLAPDLGSLIVCELDNKQRVTREVVCRRLPETTPSDTANAVATSGTSRMGSLAPPSVEIGETERPSARAPTRDGLATVRDANIDGADPDVLAARLGPGRLRKCHFILGRYGKYSLAFRNDVRNTLTVVIEPLPGVREYPAGLVTPAEGMATSVLSPLSGTAAAEDVETTDAACATLCDQIPINSQESTTSTRDETCGNLQSGTSKGATICESEDSQPAKFRSTEDNSAKVSLPIAPVLCSNASPDCATADMGEEKSAFISGQVRWPELSGVEGTRASTNKPGAKSSSGCEHNMVALDCDQDQHDQEDGVFVLQRSHVKRNKRNRLKSDKAAAVAAMEAEKAAAAAAQLTVTEEMATPAANDAEEFTVAKTDVQLGTKAAQDQAPAQPIAKVKAADTAVSSPAMLEATEASAAALVTLPNRGDGGIETDSQSTTELIRAKSCSKGVSSNDTCNEEQEESTYRAVLDGKHAKKQTGQRGATAASVPGLQNAGAPMGATIDHPRFLAGEHVSRTVVPAAPGPPVLVHSDKKRESYAVEKTGLTSANVDEHAAKVQQHDPESANITERKLMKKQGANSGDGQPSVNSPAVQPDRAGVELTTEDSGTRHPKDCGVATCETGEDVSVDGPSSMRGGRAVQTRAIVPNFASGDWRSSRDAGDDPQPPPPVRQPRGQPSHARSSSRGWRNVPSTRVPFVGPRFPPQQQQNDPRGQRFHSTPPVPPNQVQQSSSSWGEGAPCVLGTPDRRRKSVGEGKTLWIPPTAEVSVSSSELEGKAARSPMTPKASPIPGSENPNLDRRRKVSSPGATEASLEESTRESASPTRNLASERSSLSKKGTSSATVGVKSRNGLHTLAGKVDSKGYPWYGGEEGKGFRRGKGKACVAACSPWSSFGAGGGSEEEADTYPSSSFRRRGDAVRGPASTDLASGTKVKSTRKFKTDQRKMADTAEASTATASPLFGKITKGVGHSRVLSTTGAPVARSMRTKPASRSSISFGDFVPSQAKTSAGATIVRATSASPQVATETEHVVPCSGSPSSGRGNTLDETESDPHTTVSVSKRWGDVRAADHNRFGGSASGLGMTGRGKSAGRGVRFARDSHSLPEPGVSRIGSNSGWSAATTAVALATAAPGNMFGQPSTALGIVGQCTASSPFHAHQSPPSATMVDGRMRHAGRSPVWGSGKFPAEPVVTTVGSPMIVESTMAAFPPMTVAEGGSGANSGDAPGDGDSGSGHNRPEGRTTCERIPMWGAFSTKISLEERLRRSQDQGKEQSGRMTGGQRRSSASRGKKLRPAAFPKDSRLPGGGYSMPEDPDDRLPPPSAFELEETAIMKKVYNDMMERLQTTGLDETLPNGYTPKIYDLSGGE